MRTKTMGFFLLSALLVLALVMPVHGKVIWTEYNDNPIFGQGTSVPGPKAYYCKVIYDADSFSGHGAAFPYKMWYGTSSSQTGLAYSNDGINWIEPGPVMTDGYHAQVIYDADGFVGETVYYKMWYWPGSMSYSPGDIRYTESVDGVTWTNDQPLQNGDVVPIVGEPHPAWNRGSYGPSTIFYNPTATNTGTDAFNYTYTMYFDGTSGGEQSTGLGYSADGITWNGYDADADGHADPVLQGSISDGDNNYTSGWTIIRNAPNDFEMWYSGGNGKADHGIGYAISSDGINWRKDENKPVFHKEDEITWRDGRTYTPSVIKDGTDYKIWFTGKDITAGYSGYYSIGYATGSPPPPTAKWVDQTSGSDDNDGNTEATAYETLQKAIDNSESGTAEARSIIHVKDGTYETAGQTNADGLSMAIKIQNLDYLTVQAVSGYNPKVMPGTESSIVSISIEYSDHLIIE